MNGFDAYKTYLGIKLHFTKKDYDFHRFDGKTKATLESFEKRNDKYFFTKIAKRYRNTLVDFFVANLVHDNSKWVGDFVLSDSERVYLSWRKKVDGLWYYLSLDIDTLLKKSSQNFDKIFECPRGQHPILLKCLLAKKVSLESVVVLETILGFTKQFDKDIKETIIWPTVKEKIIKYKNFIRFNPTQFRMKLKEKLK